MLETRMLRIHQKNQRQATVCKLFVCGASVTSPHSSLVGPDLIQQAESLLQQPVAGIVIHKSKNVPSAIKRA